MLTILHSSIWYHNEYIWYMVINTFAAQSLVFEGKNLTDEFLYDNFYEKTHVSNLMHFQGEIVNFFPQK